MSRPVRTLLVSLLVLAACLPLAAMTTLALLPVWSWLETTTGIEAVGHSGPADWCYGVGYLGWISLVGGVLLRRAARPAP